jgi:hypothetical protein
MDEKQISDVDGRADRAKDKVAVKLSKPGTRSSSRHGGVSRPSTCGC